MHDLLSHMNDKDKQQVCGNMMSASCLAQARINHAFSLQIQDSNNADVLLDSGLKLSDIIVTLCSKLLDYILLKSGSKY